MRRVVVTGLGTVTPIGNNVDDFWDGIKAQKVGIGPITKFDASAYKAHLAAEVKDFVAKDYIDFKAAKRMELFSQFATVAAKEAIEMAGLDMSKEDPYMVGTCIGSGVGGEKLIEDNYKKILEVGPNRVNPLLVPMMVSNMAAGNVSMYFGLKGKSINVVTACATGTNSIGEAYRNIQYGDADVMVTGGTESVVTPIGIGGFAALNALTFTEDVSKASIPFDKDRSGFVLGEGAGIVVLEELEHAKKRGAKILAELVGYGCSSDAYHITSPLEDGSGAARAMTMALKDANLAPSDIDYINAHGTSTHHNDLFESRAIRLAFGDSADGMPVSSTKSMVGHLLGAAGGVEFVVCVKSIMDGYIHANAGLKEVDEELDQGPLYVKGEGIHKEVRACLSNSLGFGGHNATLVVKKYED